MNAGGHTSLIPKARKEARENTGPSAGKRQGNRPGPHRTQDSHARNAVQGPGSLLPGKLRHLRSGRVSKLVGEAGSAEEAQGTSMGRGGREGKREGRPGERGPGRHRTEGSGEAGGLEAGEGEGEGEGEGWEGTGTGEGLRGRQERGAEPNGPGWGWQGRRGRRWAALEGQSRAGTEKRGKPGERPVVRCT